MKTLANERSQEELKTRLGQLRPETPRRWGKMSSHQMVCHLADGFRMYMGLRPVRTQSSVLLRTAVKWVALWTPLPWPHGFRSAPELDQERGGTRPTDFDRDMDELIGLISRMAARPRDFEWQPHPQFGTLSEREWMRLGYLHSAHHLRQFGC